ncbi:MAG: hypothetical protein Q9219_002540 [cf. Caloplaca sp. 3 TL-2023]
MILLLILLAVLSPASQSTPIADQDQNHSDLHLSTTPLNTSALTYSSFSSLPRASSPLLSKIYTHMINWSHENILSGKPVVNTIHCAYGMLDLAIVSLSSKVRLTWEVVGQIARYLHEQVVRGLVGFFEVYWEIAKGLWVGIMFGIPPHEYWWHRDDLDRVKRRRRSVRSRVTSVDS